MKLISHIDFYSAARNPGRCIEPDAMSGKDSWDISGNWELMKAVLPEEYHETYGARLDSGHKCVLCRSGGRVVHTAWLAVEHLVVDEIRFDWRLPQYSVCIYDVSTIPAARGQGYYTKTLIWLRETERLSGITALWIYADAGNVASSRGILSAGFTRRSQVTAVSFGHRVLFSFGSKPGVK
jgi:predicted acetyltransferase